MSHITPLKQGVNRFRRSGVQDTMKLGEIGEDRLLNQLSLGKAVFAGAGDDCAIVQIPKSKKYLVLKTDCVVEGVHFMPGINALDVGWKAMMRSLSDFAAASAVPQFALVTLIVPRQTTLAWVRALYRGLRRAANRFEVSIVGGETSTTPGPVAISVSVIGFVEKHRAASRAGGRSRDDLFVTGWLGGALKQKHLKFVARIAESRWLTKNFTIHAMMDLSDGLGADLPRLARASRLGFDIELENLPVTRGVTIDDAVSEGEDYELLFAISPRDRNRLEHQWRRKFPTLPLTRIGSLTRKSRFANRKLPRGYLHFQQPR
jgi:thiamine-monophosphate kinase